MHRKIASIMLGFALIPHIASAASLSSQFSSLIKQQKLPTSTQAVCIQSPTGTMLFSHNAGMRIIPASVSKIYVTDWALSTLPADFRYTTDFYLKGKTLYINGTADPHFVVEHFREVLNKIYADKHVVINKIIFSPTFYYNWKHTPADVLPALQQSIADELKQNPTLPISPSVSIVASPVKYIGSGTHYQFQSMPLPNLLKQLNDYSTNISADTLFQKLGGSTGFTTYMQTTYAAGPTTVHFETGSGLFGNYTTCNLTLRVLQHLDYQVRQQGLQLTDVLTVPTLDPGVLLKRTIDPTDALAMVAKSGTVNNHQSLAGVIKTTKGSEYFAVFTYFPDLNKTQAIKHTIDTFMSTVLKNQRNILEPFTYTPDPTVFTNYLVAKK